MEKKAKKFFRAAVYSIFLFNLLLITILSTACVRDENPLIGIWVLESGDMDLSHGQGKTIVEFKANGRIELAEEIPITSTPYETYLDQTESEINRFHTIEIKYELLDNKRIKFSTKMLGETIEDEASYFVEGDKLTIIADQSDTLVFTRRK